MTCHFMVHIEVQYIYLCETIPGDINITEECVVSVSKLSVDKYLNYCWYHNCCTFT